MAGQHVGYIRVSTVEQNTARQLDGVDLARVFTEKASAKDAKRPELRACMDYMRDGDTLHVHSIDRLARNLLDLQRIVTELNERGVSVEFHKERLTFAAGQQDALSRLLFQVMGAFAEFERALIRERQAEGIRQAQAAGKYRGRKRSLMPDQVREIKERLAAGAGKAELAREYGVSRQTLYTALAQNEA